MSYDARQHDFAGGTEGVPYSGGANPKLLKANDPVYVCLACHDGRSGIPDVLGTDVNGLTERAAGFFDQPNTPNYRGHNLGTGLNLDTLCDRCHFVGEMATASVSCIDCHNPHGNGKARNLQWASWPGGEPDFGMYLRPGVTGLAKYERANEGYGSSAFQMEVSNMCIDCHHSFFDSSDHYYTKPGGMAHWGRHPNANREWGASAPIDVVGANTDPAHWTDGTGSGFDGASRVPFVVNGATTFEATLTVAPNNEVFCLSCHKAHGGQHAFNMTWPTGGQRGCDQCHNRAGT